MNRQASPRPPPRSKGTRWRRSHQDGRGMWIRLAGSVESGYGVQGQAVPSMSDGGPPTSATQRARLMMQRRRRPELMDQPGLDSEEHLRALKGLSRINALSRTAAILGPPILELARSRGPADGPLRILDLATGGGDLPIALARRASKSGINLVVEGCDISPRAVPFRPGEGRCTGRPCTLLRPRSPGRRSSIRL